MTRADNTRSRREQAARRAVREGRLKPPTFCGQCNLNVPLHPWFDELDLGAPCRWLCLGCKRAEQRALAKGKRRMMQLQLPDTERVEKP